MLVQYHIPLQESIIATIIRGKTVLKKFVGLLWRFGFSGVCCFPCRTGCTKTWVLGVLGTRTRDVIDRLTRAGKSKVELLITLITLNNYSFTYRTFTNIILAN